MGTKIMRSILALTVILSLIFTAIPFTTVSAQTLTIITVSPLPSGVAGMPYNQTLTASGGTTPYLWSIDTGVLPNGLALNSNNGAITGTPPGGAAPRDITFRVTDNTGETITKVLSINVVDAMISIGSPAFIPVDGTFNVNINISSVSKLNTSIFDLSYDPAVIQVAGAESGPGVTAGLIGGTVIPVDMWDFQPPGTPSGKIRVLSHLPGVTTASGAGYLAQIHFNVVGTIGQTSALILSKVETINELAAVITLEVKTEDTVTIGIHITTASPLPTGETGIAYTQTLAAQGGIPPYIWAISNGILPAGLSFDTTSGTISGTPVVESGPIVVTFRVTDHPGSTTTKDLSITIAGPPVIATTSPLPTGETGIAYFDTLTAVNGVAPYTWTVDNGTLPQGLSLETASGAITGTPTTEGGPITITFRVTDSLGGSSAKNLAITIATPPSIVTTALANGNVGNLYSQTLTASGGVMPYSWSIDNGTLPAGLSLSTAGIISGTPTTQAGPVTIAFRVTDSLGGSATKDLSISIGPMLPLSITTTSPLPTGEVAVPYSFTLAANGGFNPYTWSLDNSTLPDGLSLSTAGIISGTPTTTGGPTSVTFKATDTLNATITKALAITIATPPSIVTTALANGNVGNLYAQTLTATGGVTPYSWSIDNGTLPAGLSLSTAGIISGTPTVSGGPTTIKFRVTDSLGGSATKDLSISIGPMLPLSITTTSPLPTGEVAVPYSFTLAANGGFNPYTWSLDNSTLPDGLSLSTAGIISGTPTTAGGPTSVSSKATDTLNATITKALAITIATPPSIVTAALANGNVGNLYSQTLTASGGVTPYSWSIDNGTLPVGLSLSTAGIISGTPTVSGGPTTIKFRVTDSLGGWAAKDLSISIGPMLPLSITTTSPLPTGEVAVPYSFTLAANGGFNPYTWSLDNSTLPNGLSLSTAGIISGTPTTAGGPTSVTFKATDTLNATITKALAITIATPPSIVTAALANGNVGNLYSQTLTASGGVMPYSWSIDNGTLPAGLSLSTAGIISGTPTTQAGPVTIAFRVTDSLGGWAAKDLSISIGPMLPLSITTTSPLPTGEVAVPYSFTLAANGGFNPYTWSLDNSTLPDGLSLSTAGIISGTPTTAGGPTSVTFKATDTLNATITKALAITIATPPSIVTAALANGNVGNLYSQTLTASGGVTPYSWSIETGTLPAGLLWANSGTITGTPTVSGGPTTIKFRVTDSLGGSATKDLSITINPSGSNTQGGGGGGSSVNIPAIISVSPLNAATGVPINTEIKVVFSKAMNAATITGSSFTLITANGPVDGTVTYNASDNSAVFKPSSKLAYSTVYTGTVTTDVKDTSGYPLNSKYIWSFTTAAIGKLNLIGFTTSAPLDIDDEGIIQTAARLTTTDGKLILDIAKGTKLLNSAGAALSTLSAIPMDSPPPPDGNAIIAGYNLGLDGATFNPPLTLTMLYDSAKLPKTAAEKDLYLAYFDGKQWQALTSSVATQSKTVSGSAGHFTGFAILGKLTIPPPSSPTIVVPTLTATLTPTPVAKTETPAPVVTTTPAPSLTIVKKPIPFWVWIIVGVVVIAIVVAGIWYWRKRKKNKEST